MNFEEQGVPLAIIKNSKTKKIPLLSIDDKESAKKTYNEITLTGEEEFQCIPNPETERQILYITGRSGSGKSYYTLHYCLEYRKMYPKRDIYMFSALGEDSTIDKLKGLKRIKLTEEFCNDEITSEDFKNSMVIFDDTDVISDKKIRNKVNSIMNNILQVGRHHNTSCIITTHTACNGKDTKIILNEAHSITIFPNGLGNRSLKYLLDSYLGLDKVQCKKIKKLNSRWVSIVKTFPMSIISQKNAYTVKIED
jgi:hypothetical protein